MVELLYVLIIVPLVGWLFMDHWSRVTCSYISCLAYGLFIHVSAAVLFGVVAWLI